MSATFVIVRHGDTFAPGEPPRRIGARTDLPLVESGRAQAAALGAAFARRGWRFDRILAAPLRRASDTAAAIRAALPDAPAPEPTAFLAEIDHGPDEDRAEPEVVARVGAAALGAWDARGEPPPGWQVDPAARRAAWRALYARERGETLLITSNGAARFALLAEPALAQGLATLKLRTGAFGVIRATPAGLARLAWDERP
ncbi:histidine phosphatase family protein [Sphingomonas sp. BK069]|uniref:histidine phosphatase family protein n=1 Tax=Sphingomonas sp. BK069 TaxID=2586979 RepID=UPI00161D4796|nr:histidine phosphatase family protein [Sphingomonas sp. BK069]MBB3349605.1 putative phosphoglycerate mutase [Sphingomonas sp. BK069]